jgi:hypothetical protein
MLRVPKEKTKINDSGYLNRLMSIPHCFALSSALIFVLPPGPPPPPPLFRCFFNASATVSPGAPDRIKFSSSSSSTSSSRMTRCLTTRLAGGSAFAAGLAEDDSCDDAAGSCFSFVISNKFSDFVGGGGGCADGVGCACARTGAGTGVGTTAGGGARYVVGGMALGGPLLGDGIGVLRDLSDCISRVRSRSISSFFLCCSLTNDDLDTSSLTRFGTVRDTLAAAIVSMSSTRSRSRRILSPIYKRDKICLATCTFDGLIVIMHIDAHLFLARSIILLNLTLVPRGYSGLLFYLNRLACSFSGAFLLQLFGPVFILQRLSGL